MNARIKFELTKIQTKLDTQSNKEKFSKLKLLYERLSDINSLERKFLSYRWKYAPAFLIRREIKNKEDGTFKMYETYDGVEDTFDEGPSYQNGHYQFDIKYELSERLNEPVEIHSRIEIGSKHYENPEHYENFDINISDDIYDSN